MAIVKGNPLIKSLSGKIGNNLVFRQRKDGTTVVAVTPDFSNRVLSDEQVRHTNRFKQASVYARLASKTNPIYAERAAGTSKNAYNVAVADWFSPPVIRMVYRHHDHIIIDATDDVKVTQVLVTIANEQGETTEQGKAVQNGSSIWEYRTTAQGNITVEVSDLAGNLTRQES